jgi:hypothetical protein
LALRPNPLRLRDSLVDVKPGSTARTPRPETRMALAPLEMQTSRLRTFPMPTERRWLDLAHDSGAAGEWTVRELRSVCRRCLWLCELSSESRHRDRCGVPNWPVLLYPARRSGQCPPKSAAPRDVARAQLRSRLRARATLMAQSWSWACWATRQETPRLRSEIDYRS